MTLVRFKSEYSDSEPRMAYELVSDEIELGYDHKGEQCYGYNVKLLGFIPYHKLEITTDPNNEDAINVFVRLCNL